MAGTPTVYVICDKNCKIEGMTKEQILTAIMQAVNEGTIGNIDAGFITTIKTINGTPLKFFVGEQAAYDALTEEEKENLFALITNDTAKEAFERILKELQAAVEELQAAAESKTVNLNWNGESASGDVEFEANSTYIITTPDGSAGVNATFVLYVLDNKVSAASCTTWNKHHMLFYYPETKKLIFRRYYYFADDINEVGYSYIDGGEQPITYAKIANIAEQGA